MGDDGTARRWSGLPAWARRVLAVYMIGFLEGSCAHLVDLARGGLHAYDGYADPLLQAFFLALVVLDPLVVVLVGLARTWGVRLAAVVTTLDVTGNWIGNWGLVQHDATLVLRPVGLLPITLFGLFVVASAGPVHRALTTARRTIRATADVR
ncbi:MULTISPECIES: hypothetical protein [Streptomycetaceae]|uniref:Uncharacterized protein n=1 Tax=Streptantibioticus cattleyicolor (strain ATCC 35852 / DSM 46488 / JCM 4925 / NBRC 14057 / NRRL 8057) TaxID=1003195 RepID=F8K1S9_STREN|nr:MULTISPECIES: hypothetical protein [Streptomycetaceae]AEW92397.1 hypothetical protein SCATT_00260 [Streptantibioticus cattleyicolor NRRL 8057 = DSM 46488]MYS57209.1 hypothetical protein [Streptomyces sp. SID5468]CCB72763.1 conserved membrane protein of unknown function [Streptantibioticus cattleyicolor NRRL 8057 = DSM 46488]